MGVFSPSVRQFRVELIFNISRNGSCGNRSHTCQCCFSCEVLQGGGQGNVPAAGQLCLHGGVQDHLPICGVNHEQDESGGGEHLEQGDPCHGDRQVQDGGVCSPSHSSQS